MSNTPEQDFVVPLFDEEYVDSLFQNSSNLLQCLPRIDKLHDDVNEWCNEFFESMNFCLLVDRAGSRIIVDGIKQKRAFINERYIQICVCANSLRSRLVDVRRFYPYGASASFLWYMINEAVEKYEKLMRLGNTFADQYIEFVPLTEEAINLKYHQ